MINDRHSSHREAEFARHARQCAMVFSSREGLRWISLRRVCFCEIWWRRLGERRGGTSISDGRTIRIFSARRLLHTGPDLHFKPLQCTTDIRFPPGLHAEELRRLLFTCLLWLASDKRWRWPLPQVLPPRKHPQALRAWEHSSLGPHRSGSARTSGGVQAQRASCTTLTIVAALCFIRRWLMPHKPSARRHEAHTRLRIASETMLEQAKSSSETASSTQFARARVGQERGKLYHITCSSVVLERRRTSMSNNCNTKKDAKPSVQELRRLRLTAATGPTSREGPAPSYRSSSHDKLQQRLNRWAT